MKIMKSYIFEWFIIIFLLKWLLFSNSLLILINVIELWDTTLHAVHKLDHIREQMLQYLSVVSGVTTNPLLQCIEYPLQKTTTIEES